MRKLYKAPSVSTYGSLREMTAGNFGHSPDVPHFNDICITGTVTGSTNGHTAIFIFGCTGTPTELLGSF